MSGSFVVPLESNPDVLNKFMKQIGVSEAHQLVDVYGLEPEMLAMIPKPVLAFILLFPVSENYEKHCKEESEKLKDNLPPIPKNLFYMRQYLQNACGTVAIFHALLNNLEHVKIEDGPLKKFFEKAKDMTPEERGKLLEQDQSVIDIHQALAREGQTEAPPEEEKVLFHFIALTSVNDELFELDGSLKSFPVSHGKTSAETFTADAAAVVKKFMARDEKELRFTVMAIAASEN